MRKITTQKGVTVYCDDYHSCDIYDIDIKPGIKSVTIPFNMYMDNLKKSFPEICPTAPNYWEWVFLYQLS